MELPRQDDDFGGDHSGSNATQASGSKRSFGDLEDDGDDIPGSKKGCTKAEEADPGVATAMISSIRDSLQNCKDDLASCQTELESAKAEIHKWESAFKKESFIPKEKSPEPSFVIDYIQSLKSSEKSLNEQLEIAQMKLAIHDLRSQLKLTAMQRTATDADPEVASENGSTAAEASHYQHDPAYSEVRALKMQVARTEASMEMIMRYQELVLRTHCKIDPITLQPSTSAGAAATGSAPSAVQLDLPQPEHNSADQPP